MWQVKRGALLLRPKFGGSSLDAAALRCWCMGTWRPVSARLQQPAMHLPREVLWEEAMVSRWQAPSLLVQTVQTWVEVRLCRSWCSPCSMASAAAFAVMICWEWHLWWQYPMRLTPRPTELLADDGLMFNWRRMWETSQSKWSDSGGIYTQRWKRFTYGVASPVSGSHPCVQGGSTLRILRVGSFGSL